MTDDSEEGADGVVQVSRPVDSVHEFYFGGYVHNVKVCHIVHTATARTQMTFSAHLNDEAVSLSTSTSTARAAPASSRSSNSEDRDGSCLFLKLQSLLAGRSISSQKQGRMKVVMDKVFRAQH